MNHLTERLILWPMLGFSVWVYIWMQVRAGHFTHRQYFVFCFGSMAGQLASVIEAGIGSGWGVAATQSFFFVMTAIGAVQRYREMKMENKQTKIGASA